jgi:hypothetical protein
VYFVDRLPALKAIKSETTKFFHKLAMQTKPKQSFHFPRTTLLIEIERRCAFPDCAARNQISLTKQEAIEYRGFDCFQCKRQNEDHVRRSELPDFWSTAS